jgi:hypothetical protein
MASDTVIVNGAALDNAANLQEDEFSTNEFVHSARNPTSCPRSPGRPSSWGCADW